VLAQEQIDYETLVIFFLLLVIAAIDHLYNLRPKNWIFQIES